MVRAVFAGSFDPITLGHLDIIKRSLQLCDQLIIGLGINPLKKTLFSEQERIVHIQNLLHKEVPFCDVVVKAFPDLLVSFAKEMGATLLIRGCRSATDFEYEMSLANINKMLAPEIETVLLPTTPQLTLISSSATKEIARNGGDISQFVTPEMEKEIRNKFGFAPKPETGFIKYGDV